MSRHKLRIVVVDSHDEVAERIISVVPRHCRLRTIAASALADEWAKHHHNIDVLITPRLLVECKIETWLDSVADQEKDKIIIIYGNEWEQQTAKVWGVKATCFAGDWQALAQILAQRLTRAPSTTP
jgi:hypothetical protein